MASITNITFDQEDEINHPYCGYDIHILRNGISTMPLDVCMLGVMDDLTTFNIKEYITAAGQPGGNNDLNLNLSYAGAGLGILFTPKFLINTTTGNNVITKNVSVNKVTGEIMASPLDPADPAYFKDFNFNMEISIQTLDAIPKTFKTTLRVYVHDGIDNVWLTPTSLNIPKGTSNFRFSVYAEFDDGVVADISYHPGISWTSDTPANATIDSSTGRINPVVSATNYSNSEITAEIPNSLRPTSLASLISDPVSVKIIPTLLDKPGVGEIKAKLVGGAKKRDDLDKYLNILFLPDGFKNDDEFLFKDFVSNIIEFMGTDPSTSPYDILSKDSINFWSCFIPSEERGGTYWKELIPVERQFAKPNLTPSNPITWTKTDQNKLEKLEEIIKQIDEGYLGDKGKYYLCPFKGIGPDLNPLEKYPNPPFKTQVPYYTTADSTKKQINNWTLSDIIKNMGLPSQLDKARTSTEMLDKWQQLFNATVTIGAGNTKVRDDIFEIWKKLSDRGIPNQVNTALGIKSGSGPTLDKYLLNLNPDPIPKLNSNRINKTGIHELLCSIKDDTTGNLLNRWGETNKDYGFVVILSAGVNQGGANHPSLGISAFNLKTLSDEDKGYSFSFPLSRQLEIDSDDFFENYLLGKLDGVAWDPYTTEIARTVAHEISHSFPIKDEYGETENGLTQYAYDSIANNLQSLSYLNNSDWLVKWGQDVPLGDNKYYRYRRISDTIMNNFTFVQDTEVPLWYVIDGNDIENPDLVKFKAGDSWWIYSENESDIILKIKAVQIVEEFIGSQKGNKYTIKVGYENFIGQPPPPPSGNVLCKLVYDKIEVLGQIATSNGSNIITGIDTHFNYQAIVGDKIEITYWKDKAKTVKEYVLKEITNISSATSLQVDSNFDADIDNIIFNNLITINIILKTFSYLLNRTIANLIFNKRKGMTERSTANSENNIRKYTQLDPAITLTTTDNALYGAYPQMPLSNHLKMNGVDFLQLIANRYPMFNPIHIVGLFAGGGLGAGFNDGIFHSSGDCLMRDQGVYKNEPTILRRFCPVCRHIIVSKVNILKLGELNNDYLSFNDPKI